MKDAGDADGTFTGAPGEIPDPGGAEGSPASVRIRYRRPPDRVDVFVQALLLDRPEVKVTFTEGIELGEPVEVGGRPVLEDGAPIVWFTFPGAWHDIGRFHLADGTFTGIYANVLTPPRIRADGRWRTTDLFLDVWLPPEGEPRILDEEQLRAAVEKGWVREMTARRARAEAERLAGLAREGDWPPEIVRKWTLERAREALARRR